MGATPGRDTVRGEEFRADHRAPGSGNAQARRLLSADELAPLTRLSSARSLLALSQTLGLIAAALALGIGTWPSPWLLLCVPVLGVAQHGLFILVHEAAHHRLFGARWANEGLGRLMGMAAGLSMCTYRVTHRLHHNHLYTAEDPDTA